MVTTVGYGDRCPLTTQGWFIGVAQMIVRIATVGAVTAPVATWILAQVQRERDDDRDERAMTRPN